MSASAAGRILTAVFSRLTVATNLLTAVRLLVPRLKGYSQRETLSMSERRLCRCQVIIS